uniref:Uncharacterized protein n=1 Tax=Anopheles culicifacies TaxID=139723 RepID=A0A182M9E1_9DIPT
MKVNDGTITDREERFFTDLRTRAGAGTVGSVPNGTAAFVIRRRNTGQTEPKTIATGIQEQEDRFDILSSNGAIYQPLSRKMHSYGSSNHLMSPLGSPQPQNRSQMRTNGHFSSIYQGVGKRFTMTVT